MRMGGRGRLTKPLMLQLQKYYGTAIRSNVGDIKAMKDAVMAIFLHSSSTDEEPQHQLCPSGSTSWCKHKRAEANGEPPPQHHTTIPPVIAPYIKEVFQTLSTDALMERCVLGATQNQNESFNSLIWTQCPKTKFCSAGVVEIAVDLAVVTFNSGQGALRTLLQRLNFHCGPTVMKYLDSIDDTRIWMAEFKGKELVKRRHQMRLDRVALDEEIRAAEGPTYEAGRF